MCKMKKYVRTARTREPAYNAGSYYKLKPLNSNVVSTDSVGKLKFPLQIVSTSIY